MVFQVALGQPGGPHHDFTHAFTITRNFVELLIDHAQIDQG